MNRGGNTFNFVQDPLLTSDINRSQDYGQTLQERIDYLTRMRDQYTNEQNIQKKTSLWDAIDTEVNKLTEDQQKLLFNHEEYKSNGKILEALIQNAIFNSVKHIVENDENGNKLLQRQLEIIKSNKDSIVAEANKKYELFEKFKVASAANPNLTYVEFCKSINQ